MATFHYEAVGNDGDEMSGTVEAADRSDALSKLRGNGLQPFVLEDVADSKEVLTPVKSSGKKEGSDAIGGGPVKLSRAQVILFTEDLSNLLGAGMQLEPALKSMEGRKELSALKIATGRIRESVRDGMGFSQALGQASPSFGELYCSVVSAGEVSGTLPNVLKRQARHLITIQELRGKVSSALIYPAFLLISGAAVGVLFMTHLIPRLTHLIESTGAKLPLVASLIVGFSGFLQAWWWLLLGGLVLIALVIWQWLRRPASRPWWDRVKLRLPVLGPVFFTNFCVQFLEMLANLLQNGMPLLKSLELVTDSIQNQYLKTKFEQITAEVSDGATLSRALDRSGALPELLTDMVRIGEQTGDMGEALDRAAERYEKDLEKRIQTLNSLIQPAVILLMALLVGAMAYLMITVIYDTLQTIRVR